ncbi:MAG: winged helix-turn-helix domain-containing protein [Candidatus Bathyarchaeia archaeon]
MGIYRDRLAIIADILEVANRSVKKTQIMYQANLSYKVLQKYLTELSEATLLEFQEAKQSYLVTSKGKEFLQTYREYSKNNKSIEKRQSIVNDKRKALDDLCSNKQP